VSTPEEPDPQNPFAGIPMFGEMMRMLQSQGPISWDLARQFAMTTATQGAAEQNVDPVVRISFQDLGRVAEMHVQNLTGLPTTVAGRAVEIVPTTPGIWAQRTLDAYRPLVNELATSLGQRPAAGTGDDDDPAFAMMAGLSSMLTPAMLGMAIGSMVGQLAARAFGQYDLPIPREQRGELLVVAATVDAFAADWSLPVDEMRLWVCLQELAAHAVLNVAHVRDHVSGLVRRHVAGFRPDPSAVMDKLGSLDLGDADAMSALQRTLGDPEVLLGAVQTPEQRAQLPLLDAIVSVIVGYVDHIVDRAAATLIGSSGRIAEAARRRRVEASPEDVFVERLFGLTLTRSQVERGRNFVQGVLERAGDDGLQQLFRSAAELPTPAEVDAPGLWLARIEFPTADN
jgi:putative hydrolase